MGFPLRANIFKPNTQESRDFLRFPVQATVLFSKRNRQFESDFRNLFMHLDQLTRDCVAFFAALDPPAEWRELAHGRAWWNRHFGPMPVTFDDDVLVLELARMFRVPWESLPALVISTDLWSDGHLVVPTSPFLIEAQFRLLVRIVERWGRAPLEVIAEELEEELRCSVHVVAERGGRVASQLADNYELMDVATHGTRQQLRSTIVERINDANWTLHKARPYRRAGAEPAANGEDPGDILRGEDADGRFQRAAEDASGSLVFPSTLARQVHEEMRQSEHEYRLSELDSESALMLMSALREGNLLEMENRAWLADGDQWWKRQEFSIPGHRPPQSKRLPLDWGLACNPAFKAFEREINLSVVQVARQGRGVAMPSFLGRFDPRLPRIQGTVVTRMPDGKPGQVTLNVRDRFDITRERHRFLMLAEALAVQDALERGPGERYNACMAAAGGPLSPDQKQAWWIIKDLRNKGSHISMLDAQEYQTLLERLFNTGLFMALMRIKSHLMGHESSVPFPRYAPPPAAIAVPSSPRSSPTPSNSPVRPSSAGSPIPPPVARLVEPPPGSRVRATLVADPKGRGRLWAKLSTGQSGRILDEGTPASTQIGDEVDLVVQSVSSTGVNFNWPTAPRVRSS